MKPFSMNLSKFKKIAQDHMSTTLKDPDGHEIKIVHSRLPAIQKKQLEGLPMAFAEGTPEDVVQPDAGSEIPPIPPVAQMAQIPVNAQAGPTPKNENLLESDKTLNAPAAVSLEQKAAREQQAIDSAKGVQAANIENGYNEQKSAIAQQDVNNINEVKGHADAYAKYINDNPIDPKHYQENRSAGQKVMNALGLLAGGIGQGLVGGSNPAMDFLNAQIDRDISAQKANSENQKTVYGAYHQLYGDEVAATSAAKASMLDIYAHKLQLVAAQLGTPQAKANADAFAAKAAIEKNQLLLDTAGRRGQLSSGQQLGSAEPPPKGAAQDTAQAGETQKPWYEKAADAIGYGKETASASEVLEKHLKKPTSYYESHILAPDAVQHFKNLAYTPKAKDDLPAIQAQYNQATQAEKSLGHLNETFLNLAKEAEEGSVGGNMRRRGGNALGSVPVVGGAIKGALNYLTDTDANKAYDSDQSALLGFISSALKGTNVGAQQIQEIVDANSPERGDSPDLIKKKLNKIKDFIKTHTDTSLLKTWGLSKE